MPKTTRPTRSRAPKAERSDVLAVELRKREREVIAEHLGKHHGHVGETADALGLSRRVMVHTENATLQQTGAVT